MSSRLLLDRDFLRTLQQLSLVCRQNLSGSLGTDHPSRRRGPGLEFADYRRYSMGDDPRFLDWSAYLRLGKLFLKIYQTEEHVPVRILLDTSRSMDTGEPAGEKFLYAQRLAATFAFLALLRLDTAVVIPFAEKIEKPMMVSGGRERFWPIVQFIGNLSCSGRTALLSSVKQFLGNFNTRGVAVLISDFFESDEEAVRRSIEMLRFAGHDFLLVQVHTPAEQKPPYAGELLLEEVETGERRKMNASLEGALAYEREFLGYVERLEQMAVRNGGRYARAVTDVRYQDFVLQELRGNRVLE